jgi:hypothetical protein
VQGVYILLEAAVRLVLQQVLLGFGLVLHVLVDADEDAHTSQSADDDTSDGAGVHGRAVGEGLRVHRGFARGLTRRLTRRLARGARRGFPAIPERK